MCLEIQDLCLSELIEKTPSISSFLEGSEDAELPADEGDSFCGPCFAFDAQRLTSTARERGLPWHLGLLRTVVTGFWAEKIRRPLFVCYEIGGGLLRVFVCDKSQWGKDSEKLAHALMMMPSFIEYGRETFSLESVRPLALWTPPGPPIALWPRGDQGEIDGERVVDTGNAYDYFSYPQAQHPPDSSLDKPGSDWLTVPTEPQTRFNWNGGIYHHVNRWFSFQPQPLRAAIDTP